KVPKAIFHFAALPGDTLLYTTVIEARSADGALVQATSHVGDRLQAEAEIFFAHLDDDHRAKTLFEPKNFVFTMRLLGVFDVGRTAAGRSEPPGLARFRASGGLPEMLP